MPPKGRDKSAPVEKPLLLGRASNHLSMGIVGLPNVGKSLTYNFLSRNTAPSENFMFCTIEPNVARAAVDDERFDWLCDLYKPLSRVPAYLEIIDIAGLVKGASEGAGRGNAFLSHIQMVDGLFHLVRIFDDLDVVHCEGDVDPSRDIQIVNEELMAKDLQFIRTRLAEVEHAVKLGIDKKKKDELPILHKIVEHLESKKCIRHGDWSAVEILYLNTLNLLTAKPMVYLLNMSEDDYVRQRTRNLRAAVMWIRENSPGDTCIPFCATLEARLVAMSPQERAAELEQLKCKSEVSRIISEGYKAIHLIHYFTAGHDEVRCWTIREHTLAPDAGAVIHSDFRDYFICVDVMKYADLRELGSERAVHDAGKVVQAGKSYVVQDGDVLHFRCTQRASTSGKKK